MLSIKEKDFKELVNFIKDNFGINLTQKRSLIEGRLSNVILEKGFEDFGKYLDFVFSDTSGKEIATLINKLTTNHTFFLRESRHFEFMAREVLPYLDTTVKDKDLRIWSAGCSSGEEPYTIAMILADFFKENSMIWDYKVLATDISMRVLENAIKGVYPKEELDSIPPMWKVNYFEKIDKNNYKVSNQIKKEVVFRIFNLMEKTFPFKKKFHVIFCRNVMIYFDQETKAELFKKFYEYTETGGYLFIGHSESMGRDNPGYNYLMPAIYRKG